MKGDRREGDAGRQVGRERWKQVSGPWTMTGEHGTLVAGASTIGDWDAGDIYSAWESPQGYTGAIERREPETGGVESTTYAAGPFRTQARSQIAAEALGTRIGKGTADPYRRTRAFLSHEELGYDG